MGSAVALSLPASFPPFVTRSLTGSDDVEDAGLLLLSDGVAAPAHERAVLQRPRRREGEHRGRPVGPDEALLNLRPSAIMTISPQELKIN